VISFNALKPFEYKKGFKKPMDGRLLDINAGYP